MELIEKTEVTNYLNFYKFRAPKKSLPPIAWRKLALTKNIIEEKFLNLSNELQDLSPLILELYPDLSWVEMSLLNHDLQALDLPVFDQILSLYGSAGTENLLLTLNLLPMRPEGFLAWAHERRLSPRDLAPLRTHRDLMAFDFFLKDLSKCQPTRQIGVQLLELATELFLMDPIANDVGLRSDESTDQWLRRLKQVRFPISSQMDEVSQTKTKSLRWPNHIEAEWQRRGDQTGMQIKFFAPSMADFQKRIKGLEGVSEQLNSPSTNPWKN